MRRCRMTKLFLGSLNAHIYSSQIGSPQQTKVQITIKVQLGEHFFLKLGLLSEAKTTQTAASPEPTPAWVAAQRARNLEHTI